MTVSIAGWYPEVDEARRASDGEVRTRRYESFTSFQRGTSMTQSQSSGHRVPTSDDIEVSTYLEIAREKGGEQPVFSEAPSGAGPETVVVIDFGSQYSMLIARRIRECNVYCEIVPAGAPWQEVVRLNVKGFVLSGGPSSVYGENAPLAPSYIFEKGLPVLGICYGMQLLAHQLGGRVTPGERHEYGHTVIHQSEQSELFADLPPAIPVWMSHGDRITQMPSGFRSLAYSDNSPVAVMGNDHGMLGLQFHPEVVHTPQGKQIIRNFLYRICGCRGDWTPSNFAAESIARIREQVGEGHVICALSGGVDSAVAATLVNRAVGDQLTCIFVNNGLLRREEPERVLETFRRNLKMNLVYVEATQRFLDVLAGIVDPETKRHRVGEEFIRVFEEEAGKLGRVDFMVQGTTYPDVIESASSAGGDGAAA